MDSNEPIRPDDVTLKTLLREIRKAGIQIAQIQRVLRPESRRDPDPRKVVIAELINQHPELKFLGKVKTKAICQRMDCLREKYPGLAKYRPLREWKVLTWCEAYDKVRNRVQAYISKIANDPSRYLRSYRFYQ